MDFVGVIQQLAKLECYRNPIEVDGYWGRPAASLLFPAVGGVHIFLASVPFEKSHGRVGNNPDK